MAEFHAKLGHHAEARTEWLAAVETSRTLYDGFGEQHARLLRDVAAYLKSHGDTELAAQLDGEANQCRGIVPIRNQ
jgi:hypothetical protein